MINENIKKFLRQELGFTNANQIKSIYGVTDKEKAYELLYKDYLKEINKQKNIQKKEKIEKEIKQFKEDVKKSAKEKLNKMKEKKASNQFKEFLQIGDVAKEYINQQRLKPTFNITDFKYNKTGTDKIYRFKNYVIYWYKKFNQNEDKFSITLKSKSTNIQHTFKFNNYHHFALWFERVLNNAISTEDYGSYVKKSELYIPANYRIKPKNNITNTNYKPEKEGIFDGPVEISKIKVISGGCNKHKAGDKTIKSSFYKFTLHNPISKDNNCFFCCLSYIFGFHVNTKELRKQFNLPTGSEISINDAYKIIQSFKRDIEIIEPEHNEELDDNKQYLLISNNHYYVIKSFEENNRKDVKTKRGLLSFDFETRPTEEYHLIKASNTKSYILKDTICCLYYKKYKTDYISEHTFITNNDKSSARQFIDWLNSEAEDNKTYNIIAHNGGKFDFYFLISNLTQKELLETDIQMRGLTIIGINYRGNLFKDSCCFLTDSLSNLSKSFKAEHGKICNMKLHDKEISSTQLCFYKPELTFNEFLNLRHTDHEFWKLYVKYCMYDCIALYEIWNKFTICVNTLIEKINPYILRKCPLMASSTIGSHSKKIVVECNKFNGKINSYKKGIEDFTGISYNEVNGKSERVVDYDKYNFLCNFKRGGISHCNKAGKHLSGITGVDIASQYPASLLYSYIPCGKSSWIHEYDKTKYGFYHLKNVKFDGHLLKPVADNTGSSLNWATNSIENLYADSYMIEYLINNYNLKSFDVEEGLVSKSHIESSKLFGKYIQTFYNEKKQQDTYKETKDEKYNEALRSTIKLYLNSLTGKLVENPSIHFSMKFDNNSNKVLNGVGITKEFNEDKINDWIVPGIMVYSYSKRLLFEYIRCLPNDSNDVIHIETDGIYFSTRHLDKFTENLNNYNGDYPCKFGEDLGNLKIEKTTYEGQVAYFLGKKFYNITMNDDFIKTYDNITNEEFDNLRNKYEKINKDGLKLSYQNTQQELDNIRYVLDANIYRIKGIPQSTIDKEGNKVYLVNTQLYEDVYNGNEITRSFSTLKKSLFTECTNISTHTLTRTIKPNCKYTLYN